MLKRSTLFMLLISALVLSSCSSDDNGDDGGGPCTAPGIATNLIGSWMATTAAVNVEFLADGTLNDEDNALIFFLVNGLEYSEKVWEAKDANTLLLTARPPSGNGMSNREFKIIRNECDEIELGVDGPTGIITAETLSRN